LMTSTFSYEGLFSKKSVETDPPRPRHAKYDFAVAYPPPETVPFEGLIEGLKKGFEREGQDLVYYTDRRGNDKLRELAAEKLNVDRGIKVTPDEVVITHGSGESNFVLINALVDPGDTVLTEQYVYAGTLNQFYTAGANVVGVQLDEVGMIPEALEETLKDLADRGIKPKVLYTIPEFQNPTGGTQPTARRREILDICHRHAIPILEDDCYVDLRFDGETQESYRAMDDSGLVSHVASFSKLLVPGLRLGYFVAPRELRNRTFGFRSSNTANHFASLAVEGYLSGHLQEHKENLANILREKRNAMVSALGENFGGVGATWSEPVGGCYVWLTMPEGTRMDELQETAFESGVGYIPGVNFAPNGDGQNCARLCFAYESPQKNREGVALLADILAKNGQMKAAPAG
ncbi:MAG: PLP-dependent aminotransferase family protein, partial [Chloroflexota bacterium]